ncbi:MAG: thiamine diphosphokinase [Candidatus Beckwithbacteria bacterium]
MKRAVVLLNGELADTRLVTKIIKKSDLIVGVDGGTKQILNLKLVPDLIIGDLDSLKVLPKDVPLIRFPKDKDKTDSELAIEFLIKQGYQQVVIGGFLGKRLDHFVSNILNLAKSKIQVQIIEGRQIIYFVKNSLTIKGEKGDLVSLIPLLVDCSGVITTGLKWPLKQEILKIGSSLGISNEMTGTKATIKLKSGLLMLVHTKRQ